MNDFISIEKISDMESFFYASIIFVLLSSCSTSDDQTKQKAEEIRIIDELGNEIRTLVDSSVCNNETDCAYIAFGSKPCGGPWSYLVYSTSIDVDLLKSKVEQYNKMEDEYNKKHGIGSDCAVVLPPSSLKCENGKCVGVYPQIQA